jgi:hypothetical protein
MGGGVVLDGLKTKRSVAAIKVAPLRHVTPNLVWSSSCSTRLSVIPSSSHCGREPASASNSRTWVDEARPAELVGGEVHAHVPQQAWLFGSPHVRL